MREYKEALHHEPHHQPALRAVAAAGADELTAYNKWAV
jgi:hypothetical protein